jgi:Ammonium Transporter Family
LIGVVYGLYGGDGGDGWWLICLYDYSDDPYPCARRPTQKSFACTDVHINPTIPPVPPLSTQGALVYFMQTGFAMLTAGSVRAKNVKNVLLWNLLDSCGGGLAYWMCGWAFAYGGDDLTDTSWTFVGHRNFFLRHEEEVPFHVWFFQFTFACAVSSYVLYFPNQTDCGMDDDE